MNQIFLSVRRALIFSETERSTTLNFIPIGTLVSPRREGLCDAPSWQARAKPDGALLLRGSDSDVRETWGDPWAASLGAFEPGGYPIGAVRGEARASNPVHSSPCLGGLAGILS